LNDGLTELIRAGLRNPVKVVVKVQTADQNLAGNEAAPTALTNQYIAVPKVAWKMPQLVRLLNHLAYPDRKQKTSGARKLIVYFATCACVEYFYKVCWGPASSFLSYSSLMIGYLTDAKIRLDITRFFQFSKN
jgi:ATP-dependent RNA helicase DDX55/SPB4